MSSVLSARNVIYPKMIKLDLTLSPITYNVATGALAVTPAISSSSAPGLAGFLAVFSQYAIVGVRLHIRQLTSSTPDGMVWVAIDEQNNFSPTAANLSPYDKLNIMLTSSDVAKDYKLSWKADDYFKCEWVASNTASTVFYLKLFASVAGTFTNVATTASLFITGSMAVCFRGLA